MGPGAVPRPSVRHAVYEAGWAQPDPWSHSPAKDRPTGRGRGGAARQPPRPSVQASLRCACTEAASCRVARLLLVSTWWRQGWEMGGTNSMSSPWWEEQSLARDPRQLWLGAKTATDPARASYHRIYTYMHAI